MSADVLVDELGDAGIKISRRTAGYRLRAQRGRLKAERSDKKNGASSAPLQGKQREPTVIDHADIDGKAPSTLEEDLVVLRAQRRQAAQDGNFPSMMALGRLVVQTEEALRKTRAKQPEKAGDNPDHRARAASAWAKLHKMIDEEAKEHGADAAR